MAGLSIAMIGTRGVPAAYGGFETAVEEIGARLVERGHQVTVYCRRGRGARPSEWRGMRLVYAPALRIKAAETLSHSALSVMHLALDNRHRPDAAFVFNAANAPFVPFLRALRIPVAVHVDGLEWKREKWRGAGRRYYRWAESHAVRHADSLIADARGIADYYRSVHGAATELLTYGAPIIDESAHAAIDRIGLSPRGYHLVVARFEPENHVDVIVAGYARSDSALPLVVVGSAPYAAAHTARIAELAAGDDRIRLLGGVFDQELLDELYANAATYLHGHSVGGTNPSLLRAMGAGAHVIAWDVSFNREVAGEVATYFCDADGVTERLTEAESTPDVTFARGVRLRERARRLYDWEHVADGYEDLALRLASLRSAGSSRPAKPQEPMQANREVSTS
jgi:glycosyltransferase involved in cell wall biosynthesis